MENNSAVKAPTTAKIIVLAGMWRRAFAFLIDILCVLALSALIYFPCVVPFAVDRDSYVANTERINEIALESGLYVNHEGEAISPLSMANFETLGDLSLKKIAYEGETYEFAMLDSLFVYWTTLATDYGQPSNYTPESFPTAVLGVGKSDSNLASFYFDDEKGHYAVTLAEGGKEGTALEYVCNRFNEALLSLTDSPEYLELDKANAKIMQFALLMALPVVIGSCLIFMAIIPICLGDGQSLGKKAMKIVVLDDMGYTYNKWKLIGRNLFCFIVEFVGGIASFGALLLITYTMSMFTKKHRSIHDYLFGSVVADSEASLWFDSPVEEELFNAKRKKEEAEKSRREHLPNQESEEGNDDEKEE